MKSKTKKQTYIEKKRQEYASNQAYIQKVVNLSDLEYYSVAFETGCLFLEYLFPADTSWATYYSLHAYCPEFWIWWKAQWYKWESEAIVCLKNARATITRALWLEEMQQMITESYVESSFHHNYIKSVQNHLSIVK